MQTATIALQPHLDGRGTSSFPGREISSPPLAVRYHAVERVARDKGDRLLDFAFRKFSRLAYQRHRDPNTRTPFEIGAEGDMLFRGNSQRVVENVNRARGADRGHDGGNGSGYGFCNRIAQPAADLPGRSIGPDGLGIDSPVQKTIKILE